MIEVRVEKIERLARERLRLAGVYGDGADRILAKARESSRLWLEPTATRRMAPEKEFEARLCAAFVSVALLHAVIEAQRGELKPGIMVRDD